MPNLFQRIAKGIGDLLGIGQAAPPPPPPPPPAPPQEPEEEPEEEIEIPEEEETENIYYFSRDGAVLGRWEVGTEYEPPTIGDIEALLRVSDDGRDGLPFYTYIIYGIPAKDSPDRRKTRDIENTEPGYLGFVVTMLDAWEDLYGANTVEDYFNELLSLTGVVWTRIDTVQILDKRKP